MSIEDPEMLYTIPYNNSEPESFLECFEPYRANIHSFYFSFPGLFLTHNPTRDSAEERLGKDTNTYRFLEMINGRYKSVLCINTLVYPGDLTEISYKIIREMTVLVEQFGLTAVNVASPTLAEVIRHYFPMVDIQTSCNTYSYITNMYRFWNEKFGSTVFNLPREALRTPWLLDQFRETGFVSKCIVNEGCLYGCPGNIEHACTFVIPNSAVCLFCDRNDFHLSDVFKTNFVPPHRIGEFEGKIDIAKIAGRYFETERILKIFLAYLNQDPEAEIWMLMHARARRWLKDNKINFPAKAWPKKTLTSECKECSTCNICRKTMEHIVERSGIAPQELTMPI